MTQLLGNLRRECEFEEQAGVAYILAILQSFELS